MKAATYYAYAYSNRNSISIHAAREGGDVNVSVCKVFAKISIHAAREGGDVLIQRTCPLQHYFNPRRP